MAEAGPCSPRSPPSGASARIHGALRAPRPMQKSRLPPEQTQQGSTSYGFSFHASFAWREYVWNQSQTIPIIHRFCPPPPPKNFSFPASDHLPSVRPERPGFAHPVRGVPGDDLLLPDPAVLPAELPHAGVVGGRGDLGESPPLLDLPGDPLGIL